MNMFKPTKAKSVKGYIEALPPDRREVIKAVDKLIKSITPSLKPHFAYNMLGYGSFKYKNYAGKILDWPTVALASQKNYISLYVCAVQSGEYVAQKHAKELGKVNVGRSCIRFKKFEDLHLPTLKKILKLAEKNPGLVQD